VSSFRGVQYTLICNDLPELWRHRFEALILELGQSEHPEFASYRSGGAVTYGSPEETRDFAKQTVGEITKFLKAWVPTGDWMAPSREGVGRGLSSLIGNEPARFAEDATKFQEVDSTYIRALIEGLAEALKKGLTFSWSPVLQLCQWVVTQPREILGRNEDQREADPHWGWTFSAISDLLSAGVETNAIPFELRGQVWKVLEQLARGEEPTKISEGKYQKAKQSPLTISNSTERPKAIRAVIKYARWVKKQSDKLGGEKSMRSSSALMPEVQTVLDAHLDLAVDSSLGVRSVYGETLPYLEDLDKSWLSQRISRILPLSEDQRELFDAAWNSYLVYWQPSELFLGLLRDDYMIAIRRIPAHSQQSDSLRNPSERLAEHILILYGWGKLQLNDPLITEFFAKVPDTVSGHGFHEIGFGLYNTKEPLSREFLERFMALWNKRLEVARQTADKRAHIAELSAFGWWFANKELDLDWALAQWPRF